MSSISIKWWLNSESKNYLLMEDFRLLFIDLIQSKEITKKLDEKLLSMNKILNNNFTKKYCINCENYMNYKYKNYSLIRRFLEFMVIKKYHKKNEFKYNFREVKMLRNLVPKLENLEKLKTWIEKVWLHYQAVDFVDKWNITNDEGHKLLDYFYKIVITNINFEKLFIIKDDGSSTRNYVLDFAEELNLLEILNDNKEYENWDIKYWDFNSGKLTKSNPTFTHLEKNGDRSITMVIENKNKT